MRIRTALLAATLAVGSLLTAGAAPAVAAAEVQAKAGVEAQAGIGRYNIIVRTGDLPNADTWDYARVTAWGSITKSPSTKIDRDFRRGETYKHGPYHWETIGDVGWISVYKNGREDDAWYLEYVQIHDEYTGAVFHCEPAAGDKWYGKKAEVKHIACSRA